MCYAVKITIYEGLVRRCSCRWDSRIADVFSDFHWDKIVANMLPFFCFRCKIRFIRALLLPSVVFLFSNVERCENRKGRGRLFFANT